MATNPYSAPKPVADHSVNYCANNSYNIISAAKYTNTTTKTEAKTASNTHFFRGKQTTKNRITDSDLWNDSTQSCPSTTKPTKTLSRYRQKKPKKLETNSK